MVKYYTLAFLLSLSLITFVACTTRTSHRLPVYLVTARLYIIRLDDVDITSIGWKHTIKDVSASKHYDSNTGSFDILPTGALRGRSHSDYPVDI